MLFLVLSFFSTDAAFCFNSRRVQRQTSEVVMSQWPVGLCGAAMLQGGVRSAALLSVAELLRENSRRATPREALMPHFSD